MMADPAFGLDPRYSSNLDPFVVSLSNHERLQQAYFAFAASAICFRVKV